jgi:hypothetical protein
MSRANKYYIPACESQNLPKRPEGVKLEFKKAIIGHLRKK